MVGNTQTTLTARVLLAGVLMIAGLLAWYLVDTSAPNLDGTTTTPATPVANTSPPATSLNKNDNSTNTTSARQAYLWAVAATPTDVDIPGAQSEIEGAMLLKFDSEKLRELQTGDVLIINIPRTSTEFNLNIEKIEIHPGDIKVISARQQGNAARARLLLTLGQQNTFANLASTYGNYELVGNTETGWLMPSANMDQHVDPSKPDYVIPARNRSVN